jgi:predicted PurR-regulated permease PerM
LDRRGPLERGFDTAAAKSWRLLVLVAMVGIVVWILARLYLVTVPILVALVLSTLFIPPARWLARRGINGTLAAFVAVVGGALICLALIMLVVTLFVQQAASMTDAVAGMRSTVLGWLQHGPLGLSSEQIANLTGRASEQLRRNAGAIAGGVFASARILTEALAGALLTLVLLFFFVKDGESMTKWMLARLPDRHTECARALGRRTWETLCGYIHGVIVVALVDAVVIGIALLLVGVPIALPLAILVFFSGFFPTIGAIVSGALAVLATLITAGPIQALIILGVVILVQQLEGYLLHPFVMRRAVPLHPAVVLVVLTAGALLGGIAGAAFAVPFAAVLSAAGNELRLSHEQGDADGARRERSTSVASE